MSAVFAWFTFLGAVALGYFSYVAARVGVREVGA
jgi:hypothetical protein